MMHNYVAELLQANLGQSDINFEEIALFSDIAPDKNKTTFPLRDITISNE